MTHPYASAAAFRQALDARINTRSRDLVDMVLLIERGGLDPEEVRRALAATFGRRGGRPVPGELMPPPEAWSAEFTAMAAQAGLSHADLAAAFQALQRFWRACI